MLLPAHRLAIAYPPPKGGPSPQTIMNCPGCPYWLGVLALLFLAAPLQAQILLHTLASPNEQEHGRFAISVAGVPDVDGDGRGDLLIGAGFEEAGTSPMDAGRAYVFSGATGALLHTLVSPDEQEHGRFAISVAGVPDVDGDGRGDLLVGAIESLGGGRAYLFSGATGALLHTLTSPNNEAGGGFGSSVVGVPDMDGDGRGDLLIGAYRENPDASPGNAGRAYAFSGRTGALLHALSSPNEEEDGWFGASVAGVPDADGDGRGDLLIGAVYEDPSVNLEDAGRAYVFSGATGALLHTLTSPYAEGFGSFGVSVAGVPDVDGDGRGDLLVGAYREDPDPLPSGAGLAYVFSGATGTLLHVLVSPRSEHGSYFGRSVAGVPDADGDGRGDLLVGAYGESPGASPEYAGRAYAFSGAAGAGCTLSFNAASVTPLSVAPGGTLTVSVDIANDGFSPRVARGVLHYARADGPAGTVTLGSGTVPVTAGVSANVDQPVPRRVPAGTYALVLELVDVALGVVCDTRSFSLSVQPSRVSEAAGFDEVHFIGAEAEGLFSEGAARPATASGTMAVWPNPLSDRASVAFVLDAPASVRLAVYDVLGREVAVLADATHEAGTHEALFDATGLPSGAYLVRLTAGDRVLTRRVTVRR